jgi:hypothetical protein
MAATLGQIFGALIGLVLVAPFIIFMYISLRRFDVDQDGTNDY